MNKQYQAKELDRISHRIATINGQFLAALTIEQWTEDGYRMCDGNGWALTEPMLLKQVDKWLDGYEAACKRLTERTYDPAAEGEQAARADAAGTRTA